MCHCMAKVAHFLLQWFSAQSLNDEACTVACCCVLRVKFRLSMETKISPAPLYAQDYLWHLSKSDFQVPNGAHFLMQTARRFILGLTNGIIPAVRTVTREVCGPEHVVAGMTYVSGEESTAYSTMVRAATHNNFLRVLFRFVVCQRFSSVAPAVRKRTRVSSLLQTVEGNSWLAEIEYIWQAVMHRRANQRNMGEIDLSFTPGR